MVAALKRQLTQYGDIADRYAATSRETDMEPGMKEVMDKVARLFNGQVRKRFSVPDASLRHGHSTYIRVTTR